MRAAFLFLAITAFLAPSAAREDRWGTSLSGALSRARAERKPVLCLLVPERGGSRVSRLFREGGPAKNHLDLFVCVRPGAVERDALVDRYDIRTLPAALFLTGRGVPVKLISGPLAGSRLREEMDKVLAKDKSIRNPTPRVAPRPVKPTHPKHPAETFRHSPDCPDGCPTCEPAVERAVSWLLRRQKRDGRWSKLPAECETKSEDGRELTRSIDHVDVALTGTAGMALLAAGKKPRDPALTRGARFVREAVRPDGVVCAETGNDYLYLTHANFETPLGAMFLAEMEMAAPDADRREALGRVARYLEGVQDPRSGAWGYGPDFRENPVSVKRGWRLLATSYAALTALAYARQAGLEVSDEVLERGARYLRACRGRDGRFTYRSEYRAMPGYPGATAGALFALSVSGGADRAELDATARAWRPSYRAFDDYGKHWWYFLLHTALAMNRRGEGALTDFHGWFRDVLVASQEEDGSWVEPDLNGGRVFATAVAVIALTLPRHALPIGGARREPEITSTVARPKYLKPPHEKSRVKVFQNGDEYLVDLVVSTDAPADAAWFESFRDALIQSNRLLYDVTDGQMRLHRVEITGNGDRWDEADVMISSDFYEGDFIPHPWAHGITQVSKLTEIRGRREKESRRIGDWVKLPYGPRGAQTPFPWDNPRFVRVLTHELCHYLFGALDEYDTRNGASYCHCLMGNRTSTELCREANHTDHRRDNSCWSLAKALYPDLVIPTADDPGPWDPPTPLFTLPR